MVELWQTNMAVLCPWGPELSEAVTLRELVKDEEETLLGSQLCRDLWDLFLFITLHLLLSFSPSFIASFFLSLFEFYFYLSEPFQATLHGFLVLFLFLTTLLIISASIYFHLNPSGLFHVLSASHASYLLFKPKVPFLFQSLVICLIGCSDQRPSECPSCRNVRNEGPRVQSRTNRTTFDAAHRAGSTRVTVLQFSNVSCYNPPIDEDCKEHC